MDGLFVEFHPGRGRPRKFKPQELLNEFQNYIQERMANPIVEKEEESGYSGQNSTAKSKEKEHPQLLSIGDFCTYLGTYRAWWNQLPEDYSIVKAHISNYIEEFQLKGASIGLFNANIVSRLLGLKDKTEISGNGIILKVETDQETKDIIEGGLG